jgi:TRAP transporter TAXI family solute receptor
MSIKTIVTVGVVAVAVAAVAHFADKPSDNKFVTIGTGGVTGVYYPSGGAICRLMNKNKAEHGFRCSVESTGGSIYNLNTMAAGELDIGVVQSDWQFHAYNGTSKFADKGANKKLRALFALHPEAFTVLARADSGIRTFDDLRGKRVNIGNPGSGQRGTIETLMAEKGLTKNDFALASELKSSEQSSALCDNKVDAIVFVAGHPNASIKEATTVCDARLVDVSGPTVDAVVAKNSYFSKAVVPGGLYSGNNQNTNTFGVRATLVASTDLSNDAAYALVKSVFENFDSFRKLHPAFKHLDKKDLVSAGLSVPLHDGAIRYYKEAGLLN